MKKLLIILLGIASCLQTNAEKSRNLKNYIKTDSAHVYLWNEASNSWLLNSSRVYYYGLNGKVNSIIEKNLETGTNISKTEYLYNENDLLATENSYLWDVTWVLSSRILIAYNENGKYSELVVQIWRDSIWVNNQLQKYSKYNNEGDISEFQMYRWQDNDWVLVLNDFWSYDENGYLIKRLALLPNGSPNYQILYEYDANGFWTEMYAQRAYGSTWINSWLREYQYSECGIQMSQIMYVGIGSDWVPGTKTIFFNSFNSTGYTGGKVPVCHNGHTIYISKNALKAHLAHGDCIGECTVEKKPDRRCFDEKEKHEKPPFTIFPNPGRDRITIRFDKDECEGMRRVELTDFYGKLLKSFDIKDNGDLTIYRNNLHSGKYFIKLVGKEGYSAVVIFE